MISIHIKLKARELRKEGFSVKEIAKKYNIAQSTASLWVNGVSLSSEAKKILVQKVNQGRNKGARTIVENRNIRHKEDKLIAECLLDGVSLNKRIAFLIASVAYECEGGKSNYGVLEFTNSDPILIKIFLLSLRQSFNLDESKFRVVMHLHSYHNESVEKVFWSKVTSIPHSKFLKTTQKEESGLNKKEGYRGCVQIKYFDVRIKRTLLASKSILANKMGL